MVAEPVIVEFREQDPQRVVAHMVTMADAHAGWLNLSPGLDLDVPPPSRSPLASLLSAQGPSVPLGTWMPGKSGGPATVGIEHPRGTQAAAQLADAGCAVPNDWRVVQDHPRRGLVIETPPVTAADDLAAVLTWLVNATGKLCPWPRTGEWRALCHMPPG